MVHTFVVVNTDQNIVPRVLIDTSASNNQPTTEWIKEELEEELYGLTSFNPNKIKVGKRMVEPSVNCLKIFLSSSTVSLQSGKMYHPNLNFDKIEFL